ncbi:MAG: hypothetical protein V7727_00435 [Sneathiella sp.]
MSNVQRQINYYVKHGEDLVGEIVLPKIDVSELRTIFGVPDDDPMCDAFPMDENQVNELKRFVDFEWDAENFEYFLHCYEVQ